MAAAYAAFTSLMHLTAQLHDHPHPPIKLEEKQFDFLSSMIYFFQRFLEDHHNTIDHGLEIRIANAAHAAEDLIETHIADRVVVDFYGSLQRVIECMDLIKKQVMEMNLNEPIRQGNNRRGPTRYHAPYASSQSPFIASGGNAIVGIKDITINIVDKLTSSQHKSGRRVISISGMGGIGKTTLARKVYNHPYIRNYFDFFAWATISKDYNTHESLLEILHCLDSSNSKDSLREKTEYDLGQQLYQYLIARSYLVILDDLWDVEAWDKLRSFFPSGKDSGIVITTRELRVASISSHSFRMNLLDEHKSWKLFQKHVFGQDRCLSELENVGKEISYKCRGLPLSVVVIGSHLAKSPKTLEFWENIAQNLSSIVNSEDNDYCLKIVALSYTYLPVHLKPCFLYMAIFPEDEEISVSKLINLWVAEGFVKPINGKNLEDTAREYLNDLIGRHLILTSETSRRGRIKGCKIHDLLRDFCLKEASKKNFICVVKKLEDLSILNNERRIVVLPSALEEVSTIDLPYKRRKLSDNVGGKVSRLNEPMVNHHKFDIGTVVKARVLLRSLIFRGELPLFENKLLRVLTWYGKYAAGNYISHTLLPDAFKQMVNTRYLDFNVGRCDDIFNLPSSIYLLWNLQYVIISFVKAPLEIWKLPQLRYINVEYFILPRPESNDNIIMENLHTAKEVLNFNFCDEVVRRIPNIKKLEVLYHDRVEGSDEGARTLHNVYRLQKLESFKCSIRILNDEQYYDPKILQPIFPHSLKKLHFAFLHWNDVTTKIGWLPLLEVLELRFCIGDEWELNDGQFVELKFLGLYDCLSLRHLTANNNHFPCLQRLILNGMESLEEISSEIGDISTLESIELEYCPESTGRSAKEIADEQYGLGNEDLQISVTLSKRKATILESLNACNFHIK